MFLLDIFFNSFFKNSREVVKTAQESHTPSTQVLPTVTSYTAIAHYENRETDISPLLFITLWTTLTFLYVSIQ